ncbi:MAG: phage tail tape measure protein [Candidatus Paceibacterota bacterium]|jgi:TP901 family phage tail tape measure protein
MGNSENLNLVITGDGKQLRNTLNGSRREIGSFTSRTVSSFRQMGNKINSGLKRMIMNPFSGLMTGAGIIMAGKQIIDFDANLTRLGIQGGVTGKNLLKMRDDIVATAIDTGQTREDMLAGIDAIVERTGDLKFGESIKREMGIASTATGATAADMGALSSSLNQQMKIDPSEMMSAYNLLTEQGKAGKFTLKNIAAQGERLFSSSSRLGMRGLDDLRKFGALMQVAMRGVGSSEQATTAIERILSNIIAKQNEIKKLGFDVFSNRELQQFKSIDEIIKGVIISAKGNEKILGNIFGEEGIRGVTALASSYRETGGFDIYDKLVNADAGRAGEMMKDFATYSETAKYKLTVLAEVGKKFADVALSKPIAEMSLSIDALLKDPQRLKDMELTFKNIGDIVTTIGKGLMLSAKGYAEIVGLLDKGATEYGERKTVDVQWNTIPKDKQKELRSRFKLGSIAGKQNYYAAKEQAVNTYRTENNIKLSVSIDPAGHVRSTSDSLNTNLTTTVNNGKHSARQ